MRKKRKSYVFGGSGSDWVDRSDVATSNGGSRGVFTLPTMSGDIPRLVRTPATPTGSFKVKGQDKWMPLVTMATIHSKLQMDTLKVPTIPDEEEDEDDFGESADSIHIVEMTSRGCQEYSNPAYVHSPESGRKPNGVTPSTSQANLQVPSNGETNSAGSSPGSSRRSSIVDVAIAMTTVVKETNASGVVGASMMTSSASTVANGQNVPGVSGRNGPSPPQMGPRPLKSALVNSSPVTDSISILAQLKRAQARYTHPYGNSATILEELLYGDDDDFVQPAGKIQESSNAKLVVWITFCVFMVGMAGAIILGAESFKQRNDAFASRNLTSVLSNGTLT